MEDDKEWVWGMGNLKAGFRISHARNNVSVLLEKQIVMKQENGEKDI